MAQTDIAKETRDTRQPGAAKARHAAPRPADIPVHLHHSQLRCHESNMRRAFPADRVRRMARSQSERARRGLEPCVHALIVAAPPGEVYDPRRHKVLTIVAGHLRHRGNAALGKHAPLLNCVVRYFASAAEMLQEMSTENGVRLPPSKLEWARHLKAQLDAGRSEAQVARDAGKGIYWLRSHLDLLRVSATVAKLIDKGDLPLSAATLLAQIENVTDQNRLAQRMAEHRATKAQIKQAVETYLRYVTASVREERDERLAAQRRANAAKRNAQTPPPGAAAVGQGAAALAATAAPAPALCGLPEALPATVGDVRDAIFVECRQCSARGTVAVSAPAWDLFKQAAGATCAGCAGKSLPAGCKGCALAEAATRMGRLYGTARSS